MSVSALSPYIMELLSQCSEGALEFKHSPLGGVGGFALKDMNAGDLLFRVPRHLILSSQATVVQSHQVIQSLAKNLEITSETLLFTYMVLMKYEGSSEYLNTFTPVVPLDALHLRGTNVGAQLTRDADEVLQQLQLVQAVVPYVTEADLKWAKQHYNGRRYPIEFSPAPLFSLPDSTSEPVSHDISSDSNDTDGGKYNGRSRKKMRTEEEGPESRVESSSSSSSSSTRRRYDPTQGSLVPLLDVLNHSSSHAHPLLFSLTSHHLEVRTALPYKAGQEVHSNYGCANNDSFLLQFGFCDLVDEGMDVVAVKAHSSSSSNSSSSSSSSSAECQSTAQHLQQLEFLRPGHPLPERLLLDGGEGLYHHLRLKRRALPSSKLPPPLDPFVAHYLARQRRILKTLIKDLDAMSY